MLENDNFKSQCPIRNDSVSVVKILTVRQHNGLSVKTDKKRLRLIGLLTVNCYRKVHVVNALGRQETVNLELRR